MSNALDPARILEVGFGFWGSKVLLTAVEFELFTKLGNQSMRGEALGETLDLHNRLKRRQINAWLTFADSILVQTLPMEHLTAGKLAWQSCVIKKFKRRPRLNCFELRSAS